VEGEVVPSVCRTVSQPPSGRKGSQMLTRSGT
jgi:hypothetical protein